MKSRREKFLGYSLVVTGILVIFISALINAILNEQFTAKSEFSQGVYLFDVISTLGVILVPAGLTILLKKKPEEMQGKMYLN